MPPSVESIHVSPFFTKEHLARLVSRFVAVPSVNGVHAERDLAMLIAGLLGDTGLETTLVGDEARPSLAAALGTGDGGVLLNGHLDTVPVDDADQWEHDPFAGVIADGAVHGRGACDMKGGLAIQVAVAQWAAADPAGHRLVLHFAMGEERGEPGTEDLIAAGWVAPEGIVLEPTDREIGVAQRGLITLRVVVEGRSGHASRPDLTINPIDRLPEILAVITGLDSEPELHHPLLGEPAWTVTGIHAGVIPSMVPGELDVLVDRRMVPGETVDAVVETLRRAVTGAMTDARVTISVVEEEGIYQPAEIDAEGSSARRMAEAVQRFGIEPVMVGTPYSSDVRHLINTAGVSALTFGPGKYADMHARDESIDIDELVQAARSVAAFCAMTWESERGNGPQRA